MQLIRIFFIATIVAIIPVLAAPVGVETQALVTREPSVSRFFQGLGNRIRNAFQNLGRRIRSIGRRRKPKTAPKAETTTTTTPPVETRELYAREDADELYIRGIDDEIFAREFDDEEFEAREYDDELEAREFDDEEFEARDELDSREPRYQHPRELSYDILD
jgi:hypothetical protein